MKVTIKLDMTGDTQGVDKFLQQLSDDMFDYVAQHGYVLKSVNRDITFDEGETSPASMQPVPVEPVVTEMQPAMEKLKKLQEKYGKIEESFFNVNILVKKVVLALQRGYSKEKILEMLDLLYVSNVINSKDYEDGKKSVSLYDEKDLTKFMEKKKTTNQKLNQLVEKVVGKKERLWSQYCDKCKAVRKFVEQQDGSFKCPECENKIEIGKKKEESLKIKKENTDVDDNWYVVFEDGTKRTFWSSNGDRAQIRAQKIAEEEEKEIFDIGEIKKESLQGKKEILLTEDEINKIVQDTFKQKGMMITHFDIQKALMNAGMTIEHMNFMRATINRAIAKLPKETIESLQGKKEFAKGDVIQYYDEGTDRWVTSIYLKRIGNKNLIVHPADYDDGPLSDMSKASTLEVDDKQIKKESLQGKKENFLEIPDMYENTIKKLGIKYSKTPNDTLLVSGQDIIKKILNDAKVPFFEESLQGKKEESVKTKLAKLKESISVFDELSSVIRKDKELLNEWQNIDFDGPMTNRNLNLIKVFIKKHQNKIPISIVNDIMKMQEKDNWSKESFKQVDALKGPKASEEKQTLAQIWEEAQAKNEHRLNAINFFTTTATAQHYPDEEVQAFLKKNVWDKEIKTPLNN